MTHSLKTLPLLLLMMLVLSCSGGATKEDGALTDSGPIPRFLELIPAQTPYAFGALDPVPEPIALEQFAAVDRYLTKLLQPIPPSAELSYLNPEERFLLELAREVNGSLDEKGLARLGLSSSPRFVVYGIGPFPVFRIEVSDAAKFMAMLDRVETASGLTLQRKTLEGVDYRSYVFEDLEISFAAIGNEAVMAVAALDAAPIVVPYALGVKKPEASMAQDNVLAKAAEGYGIQRHGVGFINMIEAVGMAAGGGDALNAAVWTVVAAETGETVSPACQRESGEYAAAMPFVAFGLEKFTMEKVSVKIAAQFTNDMPKRLKAAKRPIPGWGARPVSGDGGAAMSLGLGFRVGDLLDIARDELRETRDRAFECEEMQTLPEIASQTLAMTQFIPPVVGDIEGARLEFIGVRNTESQANAPVRLIDAWAVVRSPDPALLFGTIKSFAPPEIQQLQIKPDGEPVAIPLSMPQPMPFESLKMMMTKAALAVTTSDNLLPMAQQVASAKPVAADDIPMFVASYDIAKISASFFGAGPQNEDESGQTIFVTVNPTDDSIVSTVEIPLETLMSNTL